MKISIGENLRQLRLAKGITQEQFAEIMGVSAQAVSRWENNSACPDITMMPGIAMYYGTSIDEIVGMDRLRKEESLHEIHGQVLRWCAEKRIDEAAELIRNSLKLYPGNSGLLMALGETLAHKTDDPAAIEEAIRAEERALKCDDVSMKAKSTTSVNLLFLYMKAGMEDKARALIKSLPHIWESREIMMPEVYDGEEYREELKKCIVKALVFLCQKVDGAERRERSRTPEYIQLGVDFTRKMEIRDMLDQLADFLEK